MSLGIVPAKTCSSRRVHLVGGHVAEGDAGLAGQLDVHDGLFGAEADAAHFVDVDVHAAWRRSRP